MKVTQGGWQHARHRNSKNIGLVAGREKGEFGRRLSDLAQKEIGEWYKMRLDTCGGERPCTSVGRIKDLGFYPRINGQPLE